MLLRRCDAWYDRSKHWVVVDQMDTLYGALREFAARHPGVPSFGLRTRLPLTAAALTPAEWARHFSNPAVATDSADTPTLDFDRVDQELENAISRLTSARNELKKIKEDFGSGTSAQEGGQGGDSGDPGAGSGGQDPGSGGLGGGIGGQGAGSGDPGAGSGGQDPGSGGLGGGSGSLGGGSAGLGGGTGSQGDGGSQSGVEPGAEEVGGADIQAAGGAGGGAGGDSMPMASPVLASAPESPTQAGSPASRAKARTQEAKEGRKRGE